MEIKYRFTTHIFHIFPPLNQIYLWVFIFAEIISRVYSPVVHVPCCTRAHCTVGAHFDCEDCTVLLAGGRDAKHIKMRIQKFFSSKLSLLQPLVASVSPDH